MLHQLLIFLHPQFDPCSFNNDVYTDLKRATLKTIFSFSLPINITLLILPDLCVEHSSKLKLYISGCRWYCTSYKGLFQQSNIAPHKS
ncbi:uncharacterized protein METZ01_LOCUS115171 [marine metagenome]|uniref:Uncharacterized protein n=1 Tax=marine metagenome TaxID=408172 RepID=A0A381XDS1_9ZZZZ